MCGSPQGGKFHGKQSEWKDWSESSQAFCEVADAGLGEAMKKYSKCQDAVPFDQMSEADQREARKLNYLLITWCKGDAAMKRRTNPDKGNGLEAWRLFYAEGEPQLQTRCGSLLLTILNGTFAASGMQEIEELAAAVGGCAVRETGCLGNCSRSALAPSFIPTALAATRSISGWWAGASVEGTVRAPP